MKILHLSLILERSAGIRKQLQLEQQAARALRDCGTLDWDCLVIVREPTGWDPVEVHSLPPAYQSSLAAKWYLWQSVRRMSPQYDFVLVRNLSPDPAAILFAPLVKNLITVHHTLELPELAVVHRGIKQALSLFLEGSLKPFALRNTSAVIGVTEEIANYEALRLRGYQLPLTFPNGGDFPEAIRALEPSLGHGPVRALFMASYFYSWHGLDLLLHSMMVSTIDVDQFILHVVGSLSADQMAMSAPLVASGRLVLHDLLGWDEIVELSAQCDIAIASLALHRKGMREACTLKVRDYLGLGLPVYSTHIDSALPEEFPYYFRDLGGVDLESVVAFGAHARSTPREVVRSAAEPLLNKADLMTRLARQLQELQRLDP